jgi:HSP20 family protein
MAPDSFERQVDQLLDEALQGNHGGSSVWWPACDLYEDDSTFSVAVALPGCRTDQIDVHVEGKMLTVKGQRETESLHGRIWYLQNIPTGPFACSVKLPEYVDDHRSKISFEHGVLTITFVKCEEARTRRVVV